MSTFRVAVVVLVLCALGCASEPAVFVDHPAPPRASVPESTKVRAGAGCSDEDLGRPARQVLRGSATYYHDSLAGNSTASGVPYDPRAYSAAHRTLPFGTRLRITRTDVTMPPVCVTVNDRGPYAARSRIVDLSRRAAEALKMTGKGVVPVRVDVF